MNTRKGIPPSVIADVLATSRRRCCMCFSLSNDASEKRGQIAHLDKDASNSSRENLVFLCLDHHDLYDSRTSQSKGITIDEVRQYRAQLTRHVAQSLPQSDLDIARSLLANLDRPAFRTHFQEESSLPRFREAIAETISAINLGRAPGGEQLPSKNDIRDPSIRIMLDEVVGALVNLRATFDGLLRSKAIRPCECQNPECPTFMLTQSAANEMDQKRVDLLQIALKITPDLTLKFY